MRSSASLTPEGLTISPRGWAKFLALAPRPLRVSTTDIESTTEMSALEVGRMLGWRLGGTALSRQRAMGWFSVRGQRGARAWVWLTPGRRVHVFHLKGRLRMVAVPVDWFAD